MNTTEVLMPPWRKEPPTVEEVRKNSYWWYRWDVGGQRGTSPAELRIGSLWFVDGRERKERVLCCERHIGDMFGVVGWAPMPAPPSTAWRAEPPTVAEVLKNPHWRYAWATEAFTGTSGVQLVVKDGAVCLSHLPNSLDEIKAWIPDQWARAPKPGAEGK